MVKEFIHGTPSPLNFLLKKQIIDKVCMSYTYVPLKVTMDNLKCNYLATSPPFILQAVRSRRMKQVILEVDKTQLVVRGVQQPTL